MPVDSGGGFVNVLSRAFAIKAFFVLFLVFYAVFALILFRQIQLMAKALPTPVVPFVKFLAILQIGVALALLFIVIGVF